MTRLRIPETPGDLTPEWLTAALTETGMLSGERVATVRWERVGAEYGFTGLVGRLHLRYEPARGDMPASLVAKLPMARGDTASGYRTLQERDPVLMRRYYERCSREVRFYREIAAALAPRSYYAAADDARRRVVLLLEDLSDGQQGDDLTGCSIEEAALVLEELAPFHARWWGRRAPTDGFHRLGGDAKQREKRYAGQVDGFLERYGDSLPTAVRGIVRELGLRLAGIAEALYRRPQALIHGDLQLDNLIFGSQESRRPLAVLDWQTVFVGPPAWDVTLFLVRSLEVQDRRAAEAELLGSYVELLAAHGVHGYTVQDLGLDVRFALLLLLAGTVGWLTTLDQDSLVGRERALHEAALRDGRLVAALLDHEVEAMLTRD